MPERKNIFISFRFEDKKLASFLKDTLVELSNHNLDVHICTEIQGSSDWRDWIEDKLKETDALIFLYTSGTEKFRWCFYEIGLYRGMHVNKQPRVLSIKDPNIKEWPSTIGNLQGYNATEDSITKFFEELITLNDMFGSAVYPLMHRDHADKLPKLTQELADHFIPLVRTEYLTPRLSIVAADIGVEESAYRGSHREISVYETDKMKLWGDEALKLLNLVETGSTWGDLVADLSDDQEKTWIREIESKIKEIRENPSIRPPLTALSPFSADKKKWIPIISSYDLFQSKKFHEDKDVLKNLHVYLVPEKFEGVDFQDLRSLFDDPDKVRVYGPASIVQARWRGMTGRNSYEEQDLIDDLVICRCNESFSRLFNFQVGRNGYAFNNELLTSTFLIEQLDELVDNEHLIQLVEDQKEQVNRIIFRLQYGVARVPIQLNDEHPIEEFRGKAFLPTLCAAQTIGNRRKAHKSFYLISYVEDFFALK